MDTGDRASRPRIATATATATATPTATPTATAAKRRIVDKCSPPELPRTYKRAREAERFAAARYYFGCVVAVGAAGVVAGAGAVAVVA
jgi:carbohydrate-binding DOMON domain-containing protein